MTDTSRTPPGERSRDMTAMQRTRRSARGGLPTVLPPFVTMSTDRWRCRSTARPEHPDGTSCCPASCTSPRGSASTPSRTAPSSTPSVVGAAAGRAASPTGADRSPDERPVGVPRLALAAVRVLANGGRHRWCARSSRSPPTSSRSRGRRGGAYGSQSPAAVAYAPDAAIINLYAAGARLGLHQDGDEPSDAPVVTISLGDTCTFRLAGVDRRTGPFTDVEHAQRRPAGVRRAQPR